MPETNQHYNPNSWRLVDAPHALRNEIREGHILKELGGHPVPIHIPCDRDGISL